MNSDYINCIKGIESKSYLELGVGNRKSFDAIKAVNKYSVDINGQADFTGTTTELFATLKDTDAWDIIFVDAGHDAKNVFEDYNNAVKHCSKWLIIHDLIPPSVKYTDKKYCSDGYKVLRSLVAFGGRRVYPMWNNFGMTFIRMPAWSIGGFEDVTYEDFVDFICRYLYSWQQIKGMINE